MRSLVNPRSTDAVLLLAALAVTALYIAVSGGGFPLDDSWIHQTYARNLAETGQWAFVPGVPSAASTSALYTVVLATGYTLGVPFALWTHGLGALALALTALLGARMAGQILPEVRYIGLVTGLTLVFAWHLVWAAASGMETMIFSLFTLLLIWLAWRELTARSGALRDVLLRGGIFGVAAGLTTLTRPEGALLVGLIGLALLVARPNMTLRTVIIWGAAAVVTFLIVLTPYLLFNLEMTGGLLPDTAAAKRSFAEPIFALGYLERLRMMIVPLLAGGQLLLIPGMIVFVIMLLRGVRTDRARLLWLLPTVWGLALIALYAAWLPLPIQHGRYLIPALPAL
ncbi:MAG: hypothetical protein GYB67_16045, partial [Chloroflexi bacterium]|nr:hypothetical protein [Chloroflexota bacterium]